MRFILFILLSSFTIFANDLIKEDVTIFEDKSGIMKIYDVINNGLFIPYERKKHNYSGITKSAFWVKVVLKNNSDENEKMVFSFENIFLSNVDFYNGNGEFLGSCGRDFSFSNYFYPFSQAALPMIVTQNSSATYYIKVYSKLSMKLAHHIRSESDFLLYMSNMQSFFAFYYGGILVLIIYNFIFFTYSRKMEFLYYAFFALSILRIMLAKNGIESQYLWFDHPELNGAFIFEAPLIAGIFGLLFTKAFFDTPIHTPRLNRFLNYAIYLNIILFFVIQLDTIRNSGLISISIIIFLFSLLLMSVGAGYLYFVLRNRAGMILLSGWLVLILGSLISLIGYFDIIEYDILAKSMPQVSSFLELLIFSLALAYSYKESHEKLEKKELEISSINQNLQKIVDEKTKELQSEIKYKENLLKELSHRVKNSLQVVSSFISLQNKYCDNEWVKSLLADSNLRIRAMASIHERLIQQDSIDYVDMQSYFETLLEENRCIHNFDKKLDYSIETDNINLLIDQATTIGLLVNEVINNIFKHAFQNVKNPKIEIRLIRLEKYMLELHIQDNGCGVENSLLDKQTSLGKKIISSLASQLNADMKITTKNGYGYTLKFKRKY